MNDIPACFQNVLSTDNRDLLILDVFLYEIQQQVEPLFCAIWTRPRVRTAASMLPARSAVSRVAAPPTWVILTSVFGLSPNCANASLTAKSSVLPKRLMPILLPLSCAGAVMLARVTNP